MEIKFKYLILIILLIIGLALYGLNKFKELSEYVSLYENLFEKNQELKNSFNSISKDKNTLDKVIKDLSKDNEELAKQIIDLKKQKQKIKYIDIVRYETKQVLVSYQDMPDSHLFLTEENIPICLFEYKDSYIFKVLPVQYSLDVVHTNKESLYKMKAYSSYSNETYEIPINLNESKVIEIQDYPSFKLNINAGISLNYGDTFNISPVVGFPFIHLSESIDIAAPEITFIENSLAPGLSIIDYRVSDKLSVVEDTWIGLNYSRTLNSNFVGITIKSKF